MVVAVGYSMVINMMVSPETWPFFFIGLALASLSELNLVAMGIIGVCLALIYILLQSTGANSGGGGGGPIEGALTDILEDY